MSLKRQADRPAPSSTEQERTTSGRHAAARIALHAAARTARRAPGQLAPADALQLQRTLGNQALLSLLPAAPAGRRPPPALQRVFDFSAPPTEASHFQAQFGSYLVGLTFAQKAQLFQHLRDDKTKFARDEIPNQITLWKQAKGIGQPKAQEVPAEAPAPQTSLLPSMARIENPDWKKIEPLLPDYGITDATDVEKIKLQLEKILQDAKTQLRGIPDLIGRALGKKRLDETAAAIRAANTAAAPDLAKATETITVGRGDTRLPHEIKAVGGLFGWNEGIVTIEHARLIVKQIQQMTNKQQKDWANAWKRPTPPPEERNPWVATGLGKSGGQKGGSGEYTCQLPLTFEQAGAKGMIVGTDTGNIDTASVIGVKLAPQAKADELIVLTGIPWKYIVTWNGLDKDAAALKTEAQAKKTT